MLYTISGNTNSPTIGFLAYIYKALQFNATNVKPCFITVCNGGDITFPNNPYDATKQRHDIITAPGDTLLGANNRTGEPIILTAARKLLSKPKLPHGPICIAFTPEEEIGCGVNENLSKALQVNFAYTCDGDAAGEIEFETFSADQGIVKIQGISIHPGLAKEKMFNATDLTNKIV